MVFQSVSMRLFSLYLQPEALNPNPLNLINSTVYVHSTVYEGCPAEETAN